jgi:polyhydroxybutyrate depolymerase
MTSVRLRFVPLLFLLAACSSASSPGDPAPPPPDPSGDDAPPPPTAPPAEKPDPRLAGRPYDVYVPKTLDKSKPAALVMAFHGYGDNDDGPTLERYFQFKPIADAEGFLYITPNGTKDKGDQRFWNATDACCDFDSLKPDDVGYVRAVVDDVAKKHNLDRKRVFAIGLSAGGFFAHRLACDASDVFASVVSQSGATFKDASKCKPTEPLAIVEIHGTKDEVIDYNGGHQNFGDVDADFPGAKETVAHWAGYTQCTGDLTDTGKTLDLFQMAGAETSISTYACPKGAVELWTVNGGMHAPAYSADFAKTIWSYFAAHPKP